MEDAQDGTRNRGDARQGGSPRSKAEALLIRPTAFLLALLLVGHHNRLSWPSKTLAARQPGPRNVILFVGDGMGIESVRAASLYATGHGGRLAFESFPHRARMTTASADSQVPDSAASATSMATGVKVNNGVISVRLPGDGSRLPTVLEDAQMQGKRVGLVTTAEIEDATPACFAAHQPQRSRGKEIARDYLERSRPDLLMGGYQEHGVTPSAAAKAGYTVVRNRRQLQTAPPAARLAGLFGPGKMPYELDGNYGTIPDLSEMTAAALQRLDNPRGFFLLVENENIDESGHANHIQRNVKATVELSEAVEVALRWASHHPETLIVVTADHETGGLKIVHPKGRGVFPEVRWTSGGHTATPVPVYATGVGSERVGGTMDNTDMYRVLNPEGGAFWNGFEEVLNGVGRTRPRVDSTGILDAVDAGGLGGRSYLP